MASIRKYETKNGEKRYMFRMYLGIDPQTGRKKQTTRRGFKTQKAAKLEISKLQLELEQAGELKKDNNITFGELLNEVLEIKRQAVRGSTYMSIESDSRNYLIPAFGDKRIRTITASQIQQFINQVAKKRKTMGKIASYLRIVFRLAEEREYIDRDPSRYITVPKYKKVERKKYYTREELDKFFKAPFLADPRNAREHAFFRTMAFTGVRVGEALGLRFSDVDFDKSTIAIKRTLSRSDKGIILTNPKTKYSVRTISVDKDTLMELLGLRNKMRKLCILNGVNDVESQFVFSKNINKFASAGGAKHWLKLVYITDPKLPKITLHGFRHTHASMLFASGVSAKQIQMRLGHASIQTTMDTYTHVSEGQDSKIADDFAKFMDI